MSIFIKAGSWIEKKLGYKCDFNLTKYILDLIAITPAPGGSGMITITKVAIDVLISTNALVPGTTYKISGVHPTLYDDGTTSGTTIYLQALTTNTLAKEGYGEFYNPKYNQTLDGFGIYSNIGSWSVLPTVTSGTFAINETITTNNGATGKLVGTLDMNMVSRVNWSDMSLFETATSITGDSSGATATIPLDNFIPSVLEQTINIGDKVIWGGYSWTDTGYGQNNYVDILNLDPITWSKDVYDEVNYNKVLDIIEYDYTNDWISRRYEIEGDNDVIYTKEDYNYFNSNYSFIFSGISVFMFGNTYNISLDKGMKNNTIKNSYFECVDFCGNNIKNNTLINYSHINTNTLITDSGFTSNILNNGKFINNTLIESSFNYNTLASSGLNHNTLTTSSLNNNTLTDSGFDQNILIGSYINSNTLTELSSFNTNILSENSTFNYNTVINSNITSNTLTNNSSFDTNTLTNSVFDTNILDNYSYINNNTLINSSFAANTLTDTSNIYNNTLTSSYFNFNTLDTNSSFNVNTLTNSSFTSNTLTDNSYISTNTLTSSYFNFNTLSGYSYFNSNTLNTGYFSNNSLGGTSFLEYNTLTNLSYFNLNSLTTACFLSYNILNNSSYFSNNVLDNSCYCKYNTLNNVGYINSNTILNASYFSNNALSETSGIYSNSLYDISNFSNNTSIDGSTINNNTITASYIMSNSQRNSSINTIILTGGNFIYYNVMLNSSIGSNTITSSIRYNNIESAEINVDISAATILFSSYPKTIYSRPDGTNKIRYYNDSDVLVIANVTD